jgi:hypothetical protein
MRLAGYVARIKKIKVHAGFWLETQKERDYFQGLNIDGSSIKNRSLRNGMGDKG